MQLQNELSPSDKDDSSARNTLATTAIAEYEKEMKGHIKQLKKYNELKDASMRLIQMIADQQKTTIKAVMEEMGVEDD